MQIKFNTKEIIEKRNGQFRGYGKKKNNERTFEMMDPFYKQMVEKQQLRSKYSEFMKPTFESQIKFDVKQLEKVISESVENEKRYSYKLGNSYYR